MLKNVTIDDLKPGMYVQQVVEQSGNMKMRSSGMVKTLQVIEQLRTKGIKVVEVDFAKSKIAEQEVQADTPEETTASAPAKPTNHADALNSANTLYTQAVNMQSDFINSLKTGSAKDNQQAADLSRSIIESVFDNQDALSCLTMIKNADEYLLEHSINCSILMSIFANHIGYDRDMVEEASLGALLMDLGMSMIPPELYQHKGELSGADWDVIKSHVEMGVEMLEQHGDISDLVLDIIRQHHERCDGSGYPRGLTTDDIHVFARMAAIVDSYDAMISTRSHQKKVTSTVALKKLTKQAGLDQDLVKQFIQCLGVYPVGSLVRLKSGRLGIISQRNPRDALNPIIMTFYSTTGNHYSEIKRLDLTQVDDEILSGVTPEEFSINLPKFFKEIFLQQLH